MTEKSKRVQKMRFMINEKFIQILNETYNDLYILNISSIITARDLLSSRSR